MPEYTTQVGVVVYYFIFSDKIQFMFLYWNPATNNISTSFRIETTCMILPPLTLKYHIFSNFSEAKPLAVSQQESSDNFVYRSSDMSNTTFLP